MGWAISSKIKFRSFRGRTHNEVEIGSSSRYGTEFRVPVEHECFNFFAGWYLLGVLLGHGAIWDKGFFLSNGFRNFLFRAWIFKLVWISRCYAEKYPR